MDLVDRGEKEEGVIADDEEKWLAERSRILGKVVALFFDGKGLVIEHRRS